MGNLQEKKHHIVIVGGGAAGSELATQLGNKLGRKNLADITLVDGVLTHLWKPLLHEAAAGTLDSHEDEIEYLAQAHWHHFRFRLGRMDQLDRGKREISLAPTLDEDGKEFIPRRTLGYDTLVIAVGSEANELGIPGVRQHCFFLDTQAQAEQFRRNLLKRCYTAQTQQAPLRAGQLHVAIAGAGATGIELAAELHNATRQLVAFGLDHIDPDRDIKLSIIEAADQILPALPRRLVANTMAALKRIGVAVLTGERVVSADATGFTTASGTYVPAEIKVWAAGIRAPAFLRQMDGLETNRLNQLVVRPTLQTTEDENIFAIGDCAACPMPGGEGWVPPRAQAAHQQGSLLVKSLKNRLAGEALLPYRYKDYGSLINLSRYNTVGSLMGNLTGRWSANFLIEGVIARLVYLSLYKTHQVALSGYLRVGLHTIANLLTRKTKPRMKLH